MQLEAGAPMIGAGDAAAFLISCNFYKEFALPYEQKICSAVHDKNGLVKLHICGNSTHLLEKMTASGADLFNVDHLVDLSNAKDVFEKYNLCYKGNIDPVADMLYSSPAECEKKAIECMSISRGSRYMLSAGCEVPADTTDEVFTAFCNAPEKYK
jgi:uroporphyrinogen-III decarboxylase